MSQQLPQIRLQDVVYQQQDATVFNGAAIPAIAQSPEAYIIFYLNQSDEQSGYGTVIQLDNETKQAAIFADLNPEYSYLFYTDEQQQLQTLLWCIEFATRTADGLFITHAKVYGKGISEEELMAVANKGQQPSPPVQQTATQQTVTEPENLVTAPAPAPAPAPPPANYAQPVDQAPSTWPSAAASQPAVNPTDAWDAAPPRPQPQASAPQAPAPQQQFEPSISSAMDPVANPAPPLWPNNPTAPSQPAAQQSQNWPLAQAAPHPAIPADTAFGASQPATDFQATIDTASAAAVSQPAAAYQPNGQQAFSAGPTPVMPANDLPNLAAMGMDDSTSGHHAAPDDELRLPPLPGAEAAASGPAAPQNNPRPKQPEQRAQQPTQAANSPQGGQQQSNQKQSVGRPPKPLIQDRLWKISAEDFTWLKQISREPIGPHREQIRQKSLAQIQANAPELMSNWQFQGMFDQAFSATCFIYELVPGLRHDLLKSLMNGRMIDSLRKQIGEG